MDRVNIYEYDRKNRDRITEAIEQASGQIILLRISKEEISSSPYTTHKQQNNAKAL